MAQLAAAMAVFPAMTLEELLWDVPETFLFQAENIYAMRLGWSLTRPSGGATSGFVSDWEKVTGRRWQH